MIYVVSGFRRSGTSAMMGALIHGGIPAIYDPEAEEYNVGCNPGNLYEIGRPTYMEPFLLSQLLVDGVALKIFFDGLPTLPAGEYKIIFMVRDKSEIEASIEQTRIKIKMAGNKWQIGGRRPFDVYSPYSQRDIDWVLDIVRVRNDMELTIVDFKDLINDPVRTLTDLKLPIDITEAAKVIDSKYYRIRGKEDGSKRVGAVPTRP